MKRVKTNKRIAEALNVFIAELVVESLPAFKPHALTETNSVVVDTLIKKQINTELTKKTTKIRILLRVENNSKFVRRKKKVERYLVLTDIGRVT